MKLKKWFIWIGGMILILIFIFSLFQWVPVLKASQTLSKSEISEKVLKKYSGNITDIQLNGNAYLIKLKKASSVYELKIDAQSGEVISLIQTEYSKANNQNRLDEEKIKNIATSVSPGKLESLRSETINKKIIYTAILVKGEQRTILKIDAQSGEVLSTKSEQVNPPTKKLTENEAVNIAIQQVTGNVDEVDYEIKDNMPYYFVKIETNDDEEAIIQIHAITGEVKSITWDD